MKEMIAFDSSTITIFSTLKQSLALYPSFFSHLRVGVEKYLSLNVGCGNYL
jgi:hypothetical protein